MNIVTVNGAVPTVGGSAISVEDRGEQMYRVDGGGQYAGMYYPKNYKAVDGSATDSSKGNWDFCESIDLNDCTSTVPYMVGFTMQNLKTIKAPKSVSFGSNYWFRQQDVVDNKVESIQIGSIGYPVTDISTKRWIYANPPFKSTCVLTCYVDYTNVADIPDTITTNIKGDGGQNMQVVYRNSTTGEIIT